MVKNIFTKCTLQEYKKVKVPRSNVVYYITNVKGKNIFFKGKQRYTGAIAISSDNDLPKYGNDNFHINKFYFNYNTGKVYLYMDEKDDPIIVQNSWEESLFDNYTHDVTSDIMKNYHTTNNSGGNNGGSNNSFGVYIVNDLPKNNIKNGIYFVPSDIKGQNNVYTEYIFINSKWETVGSSQINLSELVTHEYLENILNNYYTQDFINNNYYTRKEVDNLIDSIDFSDYATIEFVNNIISNYYNKADIDKIIDSLDIDLYATIEFVTNLISDYYTKNEVNKLIADINIKNYATIQYVTEQLLKYYTIEEIDNIVNNLVTKNELQDVNNTLKQLIDKNILDIQSIKEQLENLNLEEINSIIEKFPQVENKLKELENKLSDYVLKSDFDSYKEEINNILNDIIKVNNIEKSEIQNYYNSLKQNYINGL